MILQASQSADSQTALAALCRDYWYPIYDYVRRSGFTAHDAEDLTQDFVLELINGPLLARADRDRGKFRSLVLSSLKNFMLNVRRRERTERRGGRTEIIPFELLEASERYEIGDPDLTLDDHFIRSWALSVLESVMAQLRKDYEKAGRLELFEALHTYLAGRDGQPTYSVLAEKLGISESMIAVSIHRMRKRYGELLREQIAATVSSPEEVEPELAALLAALTLC